MSYFMENIIFLRRKKKEEGKEEEKEGGGGGREEVVEEVEEAEEEKKVPRRKWMQHWNFLGGHPSYYYSRPKGLNFMILMGSTVVALV